MSPDKLASRMEHLGDRTPRGYGTVRKADGSLVSHKDAHSCTCLYEDRDQLYVGYENGTFKALELPRFKLAAKVAAIGGNRLIGLIDDDDARGSEFHMRF